MRVAMIAIAQGLRFQYVSVRTISAELICRVSGVCSLVVGTLLEQFLTGIVARQRLLQL